MQNKSRRIRVSERDISSVRKLVSAAMNTYSGVTLEYMRHLIDELHRAEVMPVSSLPQHVIALNSKVWVTDLNFGGEMVVTLVMPERAGEDANRISIISPLGMALFGYAAGDRVEWGPWQRRMCLQVDRVKQRRSPSSARLDA